MTQREAELRKQYGLPPLPLTEAERAVLLAELNRMYGQPSATMPPVRYPPIETASPFDKDGEHLPMSRRSRAGARNEEAMAAERVRKAERDAALLRALRWL